jgi:hypothetical protein
MTRNERLARAVCAAWNIDPDERMNALGPVWQSPVIQKVVTDYVAYEAMRAVDFAPHDGLADRGA